MYINIWIRFYFYWQAKLLLNIQWTNTMKYLVLINKFPLSQICRRQHELLNSELLINTVKLWNSSFIWTMYLQRIIHVFYVIFCIRYLQSANLDGINHWKNMWELSEINCKFIFCSLIWTKNYWKRQPMKRWGQLEMRWAKIWRKPSN